MMRVPHRSSLLAFFTIAVPLIVVGPLRGRTAEVQAEKKNTDQQHWAWHKPVRTSLPAVLNTHWPRNPIDLFVLNRLEREGLEPSPEADRYSLIRRVSLDIIGLPPTPEQVDKFVLDQSPDAYENLVDRLLADPGFGERWGRMWMDLARYADSKGYGSDPLRTIWRYRDWVIDALNGNLPYDQFTVEQLAGDLLPTATHEQLVATAFHRNTMANDEGGTDDEQFRVEAVKDRVDSTMQIWMGVTMGCAKCHSHKYDPITQHEYYSFFAFFNQSEDADRPDEEPRLRSPSREQQFRLSEIGSQIAKLKFQLDAPADDLAMQLAAGQAKWEQSIKDEATQWMTIDPGRFSASSGTELKELDDHSLLATGASPATDTYTVTASAPLEEITAVRLDVLSDATLPGGGPGRAGGNFVLNDLRVAAANFTAKRPAGKYVRIEIPGTHRILSLAEVQVFGVASASDNQPKDAGFDVGHKQSLQNLAPTGTATQSSTDYEGPAHLAIDQNTDGHYFDAKSTTHTRAEDDPWWELDLGTLSDIDRIVIWNRTDGGVGTRLVNFRVVVLGNDRKPVWETKVTDPPIPHVQLELAGPATVTIKGASADFDQPGFPVAKAIDSDATAKSGWGIFPQTGKSHVAVFQLTQPIRTDVNGSLTVTLNQSFGSEHTIGRFRLAVTQSPQPLGAVPSHIGEILAIGAEQRTSDQVDELARYYRSVAPELQALRMQITRLERELKELDKLVPLIPVMRDLPADKRRTTHVLLKSNFLLPGDPVDPVVPAIFPPMPDDLARNRLGLARWLVSPDNPLSARVAANRFWSQLMGSGLVETEEDFGTQGSAPSHPELLDWLALEFMEPLGAATNEAQTWDVKRLIRQIVTSATYRQSSKGSRVGSSIDPDNRLLSRGPRQRLEAEMVRDQALALAGLLSRKIGGPSVYPPQPAGLWRAAFNGERTWATSSGEDRYRRGVYTFWRRTVPYPSMATFDAPSREICTVRRLPTNTPLQAFVTLNDPVYVEAAQALARRIAQEGGTTLEQRAAYGLQLCLCRPPTGEQVAELVELVRTEAMHFQQDNGGARDLAASPDGRLPDGVDMAELAAWTVASNVLLNLDGVLSKR